MKKTWTTGLIAGTVIGASAVGTAGCNLDTHPTAESPRFSSKGDSSDPIPFSKIESYLDDSNKNQPSEKLRVRINGGVSYFYPNEQAKYETLLNDANSIITTDKRTQDDIEHNAAKTALQKDSADKKAVDILFVRAASKIKDLVPGAQARVFAAWLFRPSTYYGLDSDTIKANLPKIFAVVPELQKVQFRLDDGRIGGWKDVLMQRAFDIDDIKGIVDAIPEMRNLYAKELESNTRTKFYDLYKTDGSGKSRYKTDGSGKSR